MKYNYLLLTLGVISFFSAKSQTDSSKTTLDEFEVTTTRVGEKSPVAHENITKEAIEDNLYQNQFPQQAVSLRNSLRISKNTLSTNVLNNAFNAAYPIGDGQPVCSENHPIDGGVFSNTFNAHVDFSEAGV